MVEEPEPSTTELLSEGNGGGPEGWDRCIPQMRAISVGAQDDITGA